MMPSRLMQWIQHAYRRRYVIILIGLLCTGWGLYVGFTAAPTWRSMALLSPSKGFQETGNSISSLAQRLGGAASLLGVSSAGNDQDRLAALIGSRGFTEDLLKAGLMQEMYPGRWDAQNRRWIGPPPSLEQAVERFDLLRSVAVDRQTGLIRVGMIAGSPEQAQAWLWRLIEKLNESERARALATAETNLRYLQTALNSETNRDLRDGLLGIVQSQLSTRMLARANKNFAVEVVDRPYLPESRHSPNRKLILFQSGIIGLLLAFFVLALERMFPALRAFLRDMTMRNRKQPQVP